ncbi:TetR/AcrR family transcriptional regulator [Trinickia sp. LjRoot230]|uniref:TetR/AcrR family transcriptional regulator n=1 Tax=Trinickia sp. LjRoot230 TaxID=3342288 RepID=UPI003ECDA04C
MTTNSTSNSRQDDGDRTAIRGRILEAAFMAFTKNGYTASSTLAIATEARVSKRELYALVGNKQEMLIACIRERAKRLQAPADLPVPRERETLARVLTSFGAQLVREISHPAVVAMFRLAIAEAIHAPEVAKTLDSIGRETMRTALRKIITGARASGLLTGRPAELTEQFGALLLSDLMIRLLLGVAPPLQPRDITKRANNATEAFLRLNSPSVETTTHR